MSESYHTNDPTSNIKYELYRPCVTVNEDGMCIEKSKMESRGGKIWVYWSKNNSEISGELVSSFERYSNVVDYLSSNDEQEIKKAIQTFIKTFKFTDIKK